MLPLQFISQWLECRRLAARKPLNDAASRRQRGASATEYALIVAMVAIALTAAFAGDGSTTGLEAAFATFISNVATAIDTGAWPS